MAIFDGGLKGAVVVTVCLELSEECDYVDCN